MIERGKALGVKTVNEIPGGTPGFTIKEHKFLEVIFRQDCPATSLSNYGFLEREDIDGATLKLESGSATRVLEVAEGWTFTDVITKGDGWLVSADKKGGVRVKRLIAGRNLEPIVYTEGLVAVYIAGETGMEIVEITKPPYSEKAEKEVLEKDSVGSSLNPDFWKVYKMLLRTCNQKRE